jgi:hypothetical protein
MTGEKCFIGVRDGRALKQAKPTITTMMGWGAKKWKWECDIFVKA